MFIYLIVNHATGKYYVGQHKGNDLKKYLQKKFWAAKHQLYGSSHLFNSMRKYADRSVWSIHALLSDIKTRPELDQLEKDFIAFLKSQDHEFGYNICHGGQGGFGPGKGNTNGRGNKGKKAPEHVRLILKENGIRGAADLTARNIARTGWEHTEEWKAAMSKRALGVHQEGHSTDEVRLHLSLSHMGNKPTEETKRKMREGQKRAWIQRRLPKPSVGTQQ